ncbi:site-2 protease family protein [Pseudoblastomonas halimionae]|uniref:Site-2 protease family protein n=1 Tax=Alteriqipengyuania halimionae TaxID=1926630 RepID=A0A6I4TZK8_9SPHN|nr:site-2 protease family protein [Alteriqipengyuania halimionae]MXP08926.1 site-2 protease family protein [Alteriqipengyuania halimionae]
MTDTLLLIAILVPCLIVAIVFHEVAHGWTALALGDPTAKEQRRLSLNPIRHVDPVGTLIVPGALALFGGPIFGWAKPVPVQFRRLRNPRWGMVAVAAAGPMTNIVLAWIAAVLLGAIAAFSPGMQGPGMEFTAQFFSTFILINSFLALFNLLPIPPFDGGHIAQGLLPRSLAHHYAKLQQYGILVLVVLIAATWAFPNAGIIETIFYPPLNWMLGQYQDVATFVAQVLGS